MTAKRRGTGPSATWVVWRLHRWTLLVIGGVATVVWAILAAIGIAARSHPGVDRYQECLELTLHDCVNEVADSFRDQWGVVIWLITMALLALPMICGAVVGATLFGPDIGSARMVFLATQSVSRRTLWRTTMAIVVAPTAAMMALLGSTSLWGSRPIASAFPRPEMTPGYETLGWGPLLYFLVACASATAWSFLRSGPAASVAVGMVSAIIAMALSTFVVRTPVAPDRIVEVVWVSTYFVLLMGAVRIRFLNGPLLAHAR